MEWYGGLASEDHNIEHFGWVAPCIGSATCKDFSPDGASSVASPFAFGPQKRTAMRNWAEKIFGSTLSGTMCVVSLIHALLCCLTLYHARGSEKGGPGWFGPI